MNCNLKWKNKNIEPVPEKLPTGEIAVIFRGSVWVSRLELIFKKEFPICDDFTYWLPAHVINEFLVSLPKDEG